MDVPLVQKFNIHLRYHNSLSYNVSDYLHNNNWYFPLNLQIVIPDLLSYVFSCFIPNKCFDDMLIWTGFENGDLSLKQAYNFLVNSSPSDPLVGFPWNPCIHPSKSILVWRFLHNSLPIDEKMTRRSFAFTLMCSLCNCGSKSSSHIFFDCNFVSHIWNWFKDSFDIQSPIKTFLDCKHAIRSDWSA